MTILENYQTINHVFDELRELLVVKLSYCYVTKSTTDSFTELIEAVSEINANEVLNDDNIKPGHMPDIDYTNISTFNISLYKRIRYYMKLLGYYLVLKGVPIYSVNAQTDLKGLITLISDVDLIKPSFLTLTNIDETQYYGTGIEIPYTLKDNNDNDITEGDIIIKDSNGIVYDSINAGEPLILTPLYVSEKIGEEYQTQTFSIVYNGSSKYLPTTAQTSPIKVLPAKIYLSVTLTNISSNSKYYNSHTTGSQNDTWEIKVEANNYRNEPLTDIPFNLSIPNVLSLVDETITDGVYVINQEIEQVGNHTITCETTYEDTDAMTNMSETKEIQIKYNMLKQAHDSYTDYAGENSYTYSIDIINEETDEYDNQYDNHIIKILIDGVQIGTTTINNHTASYTFNTLNIGERYIQWVLQESDFSVELFTYINVLSNFIIPSGQIFFLNDIPDIIYAPRGANKANDSINSIIRYTNIDGIEYENNIALTTNTNGKINLDNYRDIGHYILTLRTNDNLNETLTFEYDIKKPFTINQKSYSRTTGVLYEIIFYEDDEYEISLLKNNDEVNNSLYDIIQIEDDANNIINFSMLKNDNEGTYTLNVIMNGYSESKTFKFASQIFDVLTSSVNLGEDTLRLRCNDNMDTISLESDNIEVYDIEKDNNIFIVTGAFTQAGTINFDIIDEELSSESHSIIVNKIDISNNVNLGIYIDEDNIIDNRTNGNQISCDDIINTKVIFSVDGVKLYSDLFVTFSIIDKNSNYTYPDTQTFSYSRNNDTITQLPLISLPPGEYRGLFTFSGDNNYYNFYQYIDFTILKIILPTQYDMISTYTTGYEDGDILFNPSFENYETPIALMYNASYSQKNGVITGKGFSFWDGWDNSGLWQYDVDFLHVNIRYTGLYLVGTPGVIPTGSNSIVSTWEGTFPGNQQYAYYTSGQVGWFHITVRKISDTRLQIMIPDYNLYYEGDFARLPNLPKVTCGTIHNNYSSSYGPCSMKNLVVKELLKEFKNGIVNTNVIFKKGNYDNTYIIIDTSDIEPNLIFNLVDENEQQLYSPYDTNGILCKTKCSIITGGKSIVPLPANYTSVDTYTDFDAGIYDWRLKFDGNNMYEPLTTDSLNIEIRDFNICEPISSFFPDERVKLQIKTYIDTIDEDFTYDFSNEYEIDDSEYDTETGILTLPSEVNMSIGEHNITFSQYSTTYIIKEPVTLRVAYSSITHVMDVVCYAEKGTMNLSNMQSIYINDELFNNSTISTGMSTDGSVVHKHYRINLVPGKYNFLVYANTSTCTDLYPIRYTLQVPTDNYTLTCLYDAHNSNTLQAIYTYNQTDYVPGATVELVVNEEVVYVNKTDSNGKVSTIIEIDDNSATCYANVLDNYTGEIILTSEIINV